MGHGNTHTHVSKRSRGKICVSFLLLLWFGFSSWCIPVPLDGGSFFVHLFVGWALVSVSFAVHCCMFYEMHVWKKRLLPLASSTVGLISALVHSLVTRATKRAMNFQCKQAKSKQDKNQPRERSCYSWVGCSFYPSILVLFSRFERATIQRIEMLVFPDSRTILVRMRTVVVVAVRLFICQRELPPTTPNDDTRCVDLLEFSRDL